MSSAWAQSAAGGAAGAPPALVQLAPLLVIAVVFWLLLIRPEQQRRKAHEAKLSALKRNDEVVLSCGIRGRIMTLGDAVLGVEIARNVQVQVERSAIQRVEGGPEGREKEREKS